MVVGSVVSQQVPVQGLTHAEDLFEGLRLRHYGQENGTLAQSSKFSRGAWPLDAQSGIDIPLRLAEAGNAWFGSGARGHLEHARLIGGGLSGAAVAIAWFEGKPTLVVKFGPESEIRLEHDARVQSYSKEQELIECGAADLGPPFTVGAQPAVWRSIAYIFSGPGEFRESDHWVDLEAYVAEYASGAIAQVVVDECFERVVRSLIELDQDASQPRNPALPLSAYLPRLSWDGALGAVLGALSDFIPSSSDIQRVEQWYTEHLAANQVAPVHDWRRLHGDARFANILVNRVHTEPQIIDFGNAREGHIFADLARLEIDVWFRVPATAIDRESAIESALETPVPRRRAAGAMGALPALRAQMSEVVPAFVRAGAFTMYRYFLLTECLKRLAWSRVDRSAGGASPAALVAAVLQIMRAIDERPGAPSATHLRLGRDLYESMGLVRAHVPLAGSEREVNARRNVSKCAALDLVASEGGDVLLVAETGNSYLHTRGPFFDRVTRVLAAGGTFRAVVLDPNAGALAKSLPREGAVDRIREFNRKHGESVEGYKFLSEQYGGRVAVRMAGSVLACTTLVAGKTAFFEPYLPSDESRRNNLLFDTFELEFMELVDSPHAGALLRAYAEWLWKAAKGEGLG